MTVYFKAANWLPSLYGMLYGNIAMAEPANGPTTLPHDFLPMCSALHCVVEYIKPTFCTTYTLCILVGTLHQPITGYLQVYWQQCDSL